MQSWQCYCRLFAWCVQPVSISIILSNTTPRSVNALKSSSSLTPTVIGLSCKTELSLINHLSLSLITLEAEILILMLHRDTFIRYDMGWHGAHSMDEKKNRCGSLHGSLLYTVTVLTTISRLLKYSRATASSWSRLSGKPHIGHTRFIIFLSLMVKVTNRDTQSWQTRSWQ